MRIVPRTRRELRDITGSPERAADAPQHQYPDRWVHCNVRNGIAKRRRHIDVYSVEAGRPIEDDMRNGIVKLEKQFERFVAHEASCNLGMICGKAAASISSTKFSGEIRPWGLDQ